MSLDDRDYMRTRPPPLGEWLRRWTAFQVVFALNVAVFFVQWGLQEAWLRDALTGEPIRPLGGLSLDELTSGHFWTPFSFMFVHSGWGAFLSSLLLLWMAGQRVQALYGGRNLVLIHALAGLFGAAVSLAVSAYALKSTSLVLMGASVPAMGLLLAYAVAMPEEEVPLLRLSLWRFARLLLAGSTLLGLLSWMGAFPEWMPNGAAVCFAHVGAGLAGWYFARSLGYGGVPAHLLNPPVSAGSVLRRRPEMARAQRPRRPVVEVDMEAVRRENPRNDPLVDLMKDEIDPILDKINDHGMGSLTDDERRALERASRRFLK
jgi:membrane associated rhomboid family serine protease